MTTFPAEKQHADAIIAVLTDLDANPYALGKVPDPAPDYYTEVSVQRRFSGEGRVVGSPGTRGYRLQTRMVARLEDNAHLLNDKTAGLEDMRLAVGSLRTTGIQFETADGIRDDNGWWSGLTTWTYSI